MRIALVTQHYAPHFEGGTELVARAQARALAGRGHDVRIVAGTDRPHAGMNVLRSELDGLPVAHLPRTADEHYDLTLERPRLTELVLRETEGVDVVHLHHLSTLSSDLLRAHAAREGAPARLVTLHDMFFTCPRFFRWPPDPAVRCPERSGDAAGLETCARCLRPDAGGLPAEALLAGLRAREEHMAAELAATSDPASGASVLVPSSAHGERLASLGGPVAAFRVVPHGLCRSVEAPARAAVWDGERPLRVLHAGHRSAAKGTLDLVEALAALPAGRVELVCAGEEVEPGFDDALRRAAGALPLTLGGAYDAALLGRLAAGADLAAFPSRALESYGLVVDEALALGLPVWVSDRGALGERVGGAGRVLAAEAPPAWTAAFEELLEDPRMLRNQRDALPTTLRTAADAAADLEALYLELTGARA